MSNLKLGMSIAVRLEKPLESEAVEAFFNSPMFRIGCELTEDEYMQHIDALMTTECDRHWWFRLGRGNNETAGDKNCCLWQCHWGLLYRNTTNPQTLETFHFGCSQ